MASTTSRRSVLRGRPPGYTGISPSINRHCASVTSLGYLCVLIPTTYENHPLWDRLLLSETASHYWFEFNTGNGWVNADPLMPGAVVGQTFTTATATFAEVPDSLRAK